eukprot:361954-Chlamydomonas_euryale.AAC.2
MGVPNADPVGRRGTGCAGGAPNACSRPLRGFTLGQVWTGARPRPRGPPIFKYMKRQAIHAYMRTWCTLCGRAAGGGAVVAAVSQRGAAHVLRPCVSCVMNYL